MKRLLALLLALLTLFAVGCEKGSDPNTPQVTGDTVVKDGIPQNSLCYINASFEEGLLHFTYVNETDVYADIDEHMKSPRAERWTEDGWVTHALFNPRGIFVDREPLVHTQHGIAANSQRSYKKQIYPRQLMPGRYRLIAGDTGTATDKKGNKHLTFDETKTYWVGYFTITETDVPNYDPDPDVRLVDDVYQSKSVAFSIANVEHHLFHYQFRLQNNSDRPLVVLMKGTEALTTEGDEMYYTSNGKTERYYRFEQRFPEEPIKIAPHTEWTLYLQSNILGVPEDLYQLADGTYRYLLPVAFEGEEALPFYAVVTFDVVNGKIA